MQVWTTFKKPLCDFNFMHIFEILTPSDLQSHYGNWVFWQRSPWLQIILGKHCQRPIVIMGVVGLELNRYKRHNPIFFSGIPHHHKPTVFVSLVPHPRTIPMTIYVPLLVLLTPSYIWKAQPNSRQTEDHNQGRRKLGTEGAERARRGNYLSTF